MQRRVGEGHAAETCGRTAGRVLDVSWRRTKRRWRRRLRRFGGASTLAIVVLGTVTAVVVTASLVRFYGNEDGQLAEANVLTTPASSAAHTCVTPKRVAVLGDSTRLSTAAGPLIDAIAYATGAEVRSFALNGQSLWSYRERPIIAQVQRFDPDALELSIGLNDLRMDQSPDRVALFTQQLGAYVDTLHARLPGLRRLVLSVPAAISTHDIGGAGFVVGDPAAVTTSLRQAYLTVAGARPYAILNDVQAEVTGTLPDDSPTPRFLIDQLHPNRETAAVIGRLIADHITDC